MDMVVRWSMRHRGVVLGLTLALVVAAGFVAARLRLDALPDAIAAAQPTVLVAVPRVLEKMQARVEGTIARQSPVVRRLAGWARLKRDLDLQKLRAMTSTVPFGKLIATASQILDGKVRGRVVVEIG